MEVVLNRVANAMEENLCPECRSQLEVRLQHGHGDP